MRDKAKRRPLLRGAVALAAAAAAALALALAAQGASAATVTVPDSFNGPPASQQLKLSKSNAKWEWKGVAGDAVEAQGIYPGRQHLRVPIPDGGAPFEVRDFLDVTYENAGTVGGRAVDVKLHFNRFYVKNIYPWYGGSTHVTFASVDTDGTRLWGGGNGTGGCGDRELDVSVSITYRDSGEVVPQPFYMDASDLNAILQAEPGHFKEGWGPVSGFAPDVYMYGASALRLENGIYVPRDGYIAPDDLDRRYRETVVFAATTGGQFRFRATGNDCLTGLSIRSQYSTIAAPTKAAETTGAVQAGEEVAWRVAQKMGTFFKDTMTTYSSLVMTDPIPEGVDYKSVRLTDGAGRDITASAGTAAYDAATRTLAYTFKPSWLADRANYNGQTLTWRIAATAKNPASGTVSVANRATVSISGVTARTGSAAVPVARPALKVAKTASAERPQIGDTLTYTVKVTQTNADTDARDVSVSDALPAGLTLVGAPAVRGPAGSSASASGNGWRASCPSLKPGDELTVTYRARVEREAGGSQLANTARATARNASEATATAKVYIPAGYLSLSKRSSDPAAVEGYGWYELAGARYGVYATREAAAAREGAYEELVTDELGRATSGKLSEGRWYVAEIEPSRGYGADAAIHAVDVADGATARVESTEPADLARVTVTNAWYDDNDRDGLRPASVGVTLSGDDGTERTAVIVGDEGCSFEGLPKYHDDGTEIDYGLSSAAPEGYEADVRGGKIHWVVENTHVPAVRDVEVVKVWDDADDADGARPESISLTLVGSDGTVLTGSMDEGAGWAFAFEGLPVYHAGGKKIVWELAESPAGGYGHAIVKDDEGYRFEITCDRAPATRSIAVVTVWDDDNDRDGLRPDATPVRLLGDEGTVRELAHSAAGGWGSVAEGLPALRDGGEEIGWRLDAGEVPGYSTSIERSEDGAVFTVTRARATETTSVPVAVAFDDDDDRDGLRPATVAVTLSGSDGSRRTLEVGPDGGIFGDLPSNAGGRPITYTLTVSAPEGYRGSATGDAAGGFSVVLAHVPATCSLSVTKAWVDNGDAAGLRGPAVFDIEGDDGSRTELTIGEGERRATADGLFVYRDGGIPVAYRATERPQEGYVCEIEPVRGGWSAVNTLSGARSVTIEKRWEGGAVPPDSVWADVLADGAAVATVELRADADWKAEVGGLPAYDERGREIAYAVRETREAGWEASYQGDADSGFIIVNRPVRAAGEPGAPEAGSQAGGSWARTGVPGIALAPAVLAAGAIALALSGRRRGEGER